MRVDKRGAVTAIGTALTLTAIMAAPVFAETPSAETTEVTTKATRKAETEPAAGETAQAGTEETIDEKNYFNTEEWSNLAAANVQTYANIRQGADTSTPGVGVLLPGHEVTVLSNDGTWSRVNSGNVEGYIRNDLLVFGEEARVHYKNVCGFYGTVTAEALNIREGSSEEAPILTVAPAETLLELEGMDGEWYLVEYEGETGYVDSGYVEIEAPDCVALTVEEYQSRLAEEAARAEAERAAAETAREQAEAEKQAAAQSQAAASDTSSQNEAVPASTSVSSSDLDLLAAIIQCEAGGESRTGKVAVGAVIMNRVNSGSFPNSISEVVYQSGQFSPVSNGALSSVQSGGARSDCYEAAQAALAGENPVGECLYFNSGSGRGTQIGNQHFY